MHSHMIWSTCPPNRNIGRVEIKRLRVAEDLTLRGFVDELYRQHPVDGFKNILADRIIYIIRRPDSMEPLPLEFAWEA